MARILIFTPTYDDRLQDETVKSIEALTFDGELDWVLSDENPYPGRDMRNCVFQFQKGRQIAIDGEYDALLLIEHDMIVPEDAAQKLWDTPADLHTGADSAPVVYGTYQLRHRMRSVNLFQYVGDDNIGMSLSLYPRELQQARQAGWCRVSGAGFGCLLIRRPVFEQVPFVDNGNAPDLPFAADCVRRRIVQIGRTDVACGHIDLDWAQRTLWPYEHGGYGIVARVLALQNVTAPGSVMMKRGRYYSIEVDVAVEMERAGFVRIENEADEVAAEMETADAGERETAEAPVTVVKRKPQVKKKIMSTQG